MSATITTDEIAEQIIDLLTDLRPDGDLVAWCAIADRLPPSGYWARLGALDRLASEGRIWEAKVGGTPFIGLCTDGLCREAHRTSAERGEPDLGIAI